jgi:hypothetical protein
MLEKLEKIQLEAARIVTGLTKFASKDSLYFETGWETLVNRRETRKLTTFYKMSRLFQSETVDGINEIAGVLSLHLGGT